MADQENQLQSSGMVFMILGLSFTAIGASGQSTFLWIGIPFLVSGIVQLVLSRRESGSDPKQVADGSDPNDER